MLLLKKKGTKPGKHIPRQHILDFCLVVIQKSYGNNMDDQEIRNRRQGLRSNRGNLNKSIKNPWREANIFSRLFFWLV